MGENIIDNIRAYNIVGKEIKATDYVKTRFKKKKNMSFMFRGKEIFKPLNTGYIDERISCIKEYLKLLKQIAMVYLNNQKYT